MAATGAPRPGRARHCGQAALQPGILVLQLEHFTVQARHLSEGTRGS